MTYELIIGDRSFSSWSLRGWLMFEKFDIPVKTKMAGLYDGTLAEDLKPFAPARLVPVVRTPSGDVIGETLAIAETLAETHPDAGLWPRDASARVYARWLVSEMHAGFSALRNDCPMQLLHQYEGFAAKEAVIRDLARLEELWAHAFERRPVKGPWLFGDYSLADVFYAPVAARIAGYGLSVGQAAQAYVETHLKDGAFRRWRAMGATKTYDPVPYALDLPHKIWPGPTPLNAKATSDQTSENALCPYSQKPVTDFMEVDGRVFGFCNSFCRDKTVNDPEAWPAFMKVYYS
ncbi:MAG: glutathione S-transferase [Marinosulfonomonas sp.]